MLTVGEILKKRRIERNLTFEDIEKRTKIRKKFLEAIEKGDYNQFSSSTYLRGFIKNYSDFLDLPTTEILAIFRREYDKRENTQITPQTIPSQHSLLKLTPLKVTVLTIFLLLALFFGYLIQGYFSLSGAPYLEVSKPKAGEKISGLSVEVSGKTDPNAKVYINNQEIIVDSEGEFNQEISIGKNTPAINIVAENKNGKTTVIERIIEVVNPP
ncbi:helix-turn-helix domain-containing protein [Candidatus Gottesmanbacteria bacterium]|nr:helix-turn-helix domain-containing protein [Candidatus Gottesmanbacteria bacterium]